MKPYLRRRLRRIQNQNNLSGIQMAGLPDVKYEIFTELISCRQEIDLKMLDNLKQNFKVSADWLLYGIS